MSEVFRICAYRAKNCDLKNVIICVNHKKKFHYTIKQSFVVSILDIWPKITKIWYPDFSRIFRIRFFPEKISCRGSNSLPTFCPLLLHKLYMQFGLVAEGGRYEICKKHTFFWVNNYFRKKLILQKLFTIEK